jgi:serine/threonine-protein kinase
MATDRRIIDLLLRYEDARNHGSSITPEELCCESPELLETVKRRLADLHGTDEIVRCEVQTQSFTADGASEQTPRGPGDFGDYDLLEEIARGGMGIVFRARETSLNRIVALKMILSGHLASADEVRRFRLEAEEASRLDHPHIVPIYHIGEHQGQHYFTMKLIEGGTLRSVARGAKADLRNVARLMATVAHTIHYAHRHGVLHRDIKPRNILIDQEGQPHVTDFGLAKNLSGSSGQTLSGAILGTPGYMSPEQAASRKDLTTATDIYSVGAVLYDLMTGRPPFLEPSPLDTLVKVLEQEPVPPRRLNPRADRDLETICLTCLNKDPRKRYASAEALGRDLDHFLAGEPIRARRASAMERAGKWIRRRPFAAALVVLAGTGALLLAVGGWVLSARLRTAVHQAQEAQAIAEKGEREADLKRQQLNDYLVHLNERLANVNLEEPIRLEFLQEGLALCEQFRKVPGKNAEARRQTALLYSCLGDLQQQRNSTEAAHQAYGRAQELLDQLVVEFPTERIYRNDLAMLYSKQAQFLEASGEHAVAVGTLKQAIEIQDRLATEPSAALSDRQRGAELRLMLGTFLEEQKQPAEAEAAYRAALDLMQRIVANGNAPPSAHQWLAKVASTLGWLLLDRTSTEA